MKRARVGLMALTATAALLMSAAPVAAQSAGDPGAGSLDVRLEPGEINVVLGENFSITVTLTNQGTEPTVPLVAHIDITDPSKGRSVDPEDWTETLSKTVGVVEPGASETVSWELQPISAGSFAVYSVALSGGSPAVTVSNAALISVEDQRSLNPEGILPVALGAPVVVGALLVTQLVRGRRR